MARSRTRKKVTHHRKYHKKRVSGIKDVDTMAIVYVAAGAVGARYISTKMAASTNTTMQKIAPYLGVIAGIALPMITKNPTAKMLALGLIGGGATTALGPTGLKVISGIENTVGYPYNVVPYQKNVAGVIQNGQYVNKANWSGSGKSQASVIGKISPRTMAAAGCMS